jgi:hypothetical protein
VLASVERAASALQEFSCAEIQRPRCCGRALNESVDVRGGCFSLPTQGSRLRSLHDDVDEAVVHRAADFARERTVLKPIGGRDVDCRKTSERR